MIVTCIIPSKLSGYVIKNAFKCINSLEIAAKKSKIKINIVIVTNSDNSINKKGVVKITHSSKEFSYTEMNNTAIDFSLRHFRQNYFLFINDDAWINEDFFRVFSDDRNYDVYIPMIYTTDNERLRKIQSFGIEYFKSGSVRSSNTLNTSTTLFSACCVLINSNFVNRIIDKFGFFFNPILKSYYEDVELAIRGLAIGARYKKVKKMIAYHLESFTSGKKSKSTISFSYRNYLWVVILTWPVKTILENLLYIFIVTIWFVVYSTYRFGPFFYLNIMYKTLLKIPELMKERRNIMSHYKSDFNFNDILSTYMFRTRGGVGF